MTGQPFLWAGILLCCSAMPGCSKSPYESTASGTVTLDGAAIGQPGMIQFVPVNRSHNPATGPIQVDGSYEAPTGNQCGLPPGEYDVTLAVYQNVEVRPRRCARRSAAPPY